MSRFGCNRRVKDPSGSWEYSQLLGAKVRVKSMPVSNFFCSINASDLLTIDNIYFRVSLDGKTITVIELTEIPGKIFTWRDLEIVELNSRNLYQDPSLCGVFLCGVTLCGNKVSLEPSYDENPLESSGGISVIDESGTIITNRYIRILNADVENPSTDKDEITDIKVNFDGDILD